MEKEIKQETDYEALAFDRKFYNNILLALVVILVTVVLNTNFNNYNPPKPAPKVHQEIIIKNIVKNETTLMNLSNNEKAALFLGIPFGGMLWIATVALVKARRKHGKKYI